MTSNEIIALLAFIACLCLKLALDLKVHYSGKRVNHKVGALVVFVALTGLSFLAGWKSAPMWFFGWWVAFDFLFNILTGNPPFYIGETAWLDRLQRRYPIVTWVKFIGFGLSIPLFIFKDKMHFV